MPAVKQQFIKDEKGEDIAIILPIAKYNKMIEALEDLEDISDYKDYLSNQGKAETMSMEEAINLRKNG